ncbi:class I SAM-dependent methyltransferase [Vibrio nigripulchritudo]|uniref:class I SAM-dependent methyltransferase n=1 Tax=Vibrio nigripulchritudo TaxID=28173 RepID=UPI0003B1A1BB|nr:class I SAM-dependent methyltransferase [Vibrio nigripulchritudo]CCN70286.1 hypothetical protein VIBNISFn118_20037 [Vibrio nigripulchritudo SFn118]
MKYSFDFDIDNDSSPSYIARRLKGNSRVLEFGPADGTLTKYMSENLKCEVYGVEVDPKFASSAKKYTVKMLVEDIEEYNWINELKGEKFDYILFSDVLEHLREPKKVLEKSISLLKDDGSIFLSIPNVAHASIILGLLNDEFKYNPTGLLDSTHISFFTKKSIDEMVSSVGLNVKYCSGVYLPPSKTEFSYSYEQLPLNASNYIKNTPYREVYQFVYELTPLKVMKKIEDFRPKAFVNVSFSDLNGNNFSTVSNEVIDIELLSNYKLTLDTPIETRAIHIEIQNIHSIFRIDDLKINGTRNMAFTLGENGVERIYPKNREKIEVGNDQSVSIYLPMFESINCNTVELSISDFTPSENSNRKDKGSKWRQKFVTNLSFWK